MAAVHCRCTFNVLKCSFTRCVNTSHLNNTEEAGKREKTGRLKRKKGEMWKTVVKYLWRGASQPSCIELGFVRRRDHPCLNMSARLAKLLRLVSEMLPRSCTALARHETTPPPRLPSSPLMLSPSHQHCFGWVSPLLSIASLWLYLYHALFLSWWRIFSLSGKALKEGWLEEGSVGEKGAVWVIGGLG